MKTALGKLNRRSQTAVRLGGEWGHLVLSKASVSQGQAMITPVLLLPTPPRAGGEARLL